jgi:hypothetical protein
MVGLEDSSVTADCSRLKNPLENAISMVICDYTRRVLPAPAPIWHRLGPGPVAVRCFFGLVLTVAPGCGDNQADPIVRVGQGGGGAVGSGGKGGSGLGDLCAPCGSRSDCADDETCVQFVRNGDKFCSQPCGDGNGHCPAGYSCGNVNNLSSMQCVPENGDCAFVVP